MSIRGGAVRGGSEKIVSAGDISGYRWRMSSAAPDPSPAVSAAAGWNFDNSYARLPEALFRRALPVAVEAPRIAILNRPLARDLGLDPDLLESAEGARVLAGNAIPAGADPLAQAYAGHQFGNFTMLGDGRAILLGEQITPGGTRLDVQLKGSGQTPFSRRGDGRAALGPMLREFIISEAMHGLGIPTTRSLAVVKTGEMVFREEPLPGAVLTRIAASHIRVGTFEFAAATGDPTLLPALAEYSLQRHFPHLAGSQDPFLELLREVVERQAALVARWLHVGFVHGVMNTDNMAISGETIDYGPCAFIDAYDPEAVFSSIDRNGRYAFGSQPSIAHWNLTRLAESLLPLLSPDESTAIDLAKDVLATFAPRFQHHWISGMRAKLGLLNEEPEDVALITDFLDALHQTGSDFTNSWRSLSAPFSEDGTLSLPELSSWQARWRQRIARQPHPPEEVEKHMLATNPAIIPRNHLVEEAINAAVVGEDFSVMQRLLEALADPYSERPGRERFRLPPPPGNPPYQTFCGT